MLWLALACAPEPQRCPDECGVVVQITPPESAIGALTIATDPPGAGFGGALLDGDGETVLTIAGRSEVRIGLLPGDLVPGETYTVALDHACEPGKGKPACAQTSETFEVPAGSGSTPPDPPPDDGTAIDVFAQVQLPLVDVLFVIDNSASMGSYQQDLVETFPIFVDYFEGSGVDYHIGVVSTDLDDPDHSGKLRTHQGARWIDPGTPNPATAFAAMASLGVDGSGTERGLGATYLALGEEAEAYNAGFLREDSSVHVVVLSDEPDHTQAWVITVPEFIDWFDGLRRDDDDRTFSSIVVPTPGIYYGRQYVEVTAALGGVVWDIRDGNYDEVLNELGLQASGLKRSSTSPRFPIPTRSRSPSQIPEALRSRSVRPTTPTIEPQQRPLPLLPPRQRFADRRPLHPGSVRPPCPFRSP